MQQPLRQTSGSAFGIRSRIKNASFTFTNYARTSTIHGLLHIFQSISTLRQSVWFFLAVFGFSLGLYHMIMTTQKYMDLPVSSEYKLNHDRSTFPDVTICSLKPVAEALYHYIPLEHYLSQEWDNFSKWIHKRHLQYFTDGTQDSFEVFRYRVNQLHQVMWVSGDTRDLGMDDSTMLLDCRYNGVECNASHFKLMQNYRFWNCYTFEPHNLGEAAQWRLGGHNLDMIIYTNPYDLGHQNVSHYDDLPCFNQIMSDPTKLKQSPESCISFFCPNQVQKTGTLLASGIRVFIHQHGEFPMSSKDFVDIQPGRSFSITLNPLRRKLLSKRSQLCSESPIETVEFIKYFGVDLNDTSNGEYLKTENEFVYEEKQNIVFNKCKCYSHRYPYSSSIRRQLCYYTPLEQWKSPSEVILRNIQCHDEAVEDADSRTSELTQKHHDKIMCEQMRYRPLVTSLPWPKFEYIRKIWEDLFVPKIINGIGFLEQDNQTHHIYNYTRWKIYHSTTIPLRVLLHLWLTREDLLFASPVFARRQCRQYLNEKWMEDFKIANLPIEEVVNFGWCIDRTTLANSLTQLRIKLPSAWTDFFEESLRYDWTEVVSEIGGTFGLWIGVSLMVLVELLELFILVIVSFVLDKRLGELVTVELTQN